VSIEGSVLANPDAAGAFTITLPASNLRIVGVFHNLPYLQIVLSPGETAVIPNLGIGYRRVVPIDFAPNTNTVNLVAPGAGFVVLYYGTPLPGSKPLTTYKGVVATASPAAAGSGSLNVAFPKGTGKMTGFCNYVTTSYTQLSFNTAVGKSITFFDNSNEALDGVGGITPLNIQMSDLFALSYTAGGALTFYAFFYYA